MKNLLKISILSALILSTASCASLQNLLKGSKKNQQVEPLVYLNNAPKFKIDDFLDGKLEGFAIIQDEKGVIKDSFVVKVNGEWEAKRGTVKYSYNFNGNKKDARTWLITADDNREFTAIGHDFSAPAKGRQEGNVSEVIYNLFYTYNGKKEKVDFTDNFYLIDQNSAIILTDMHLGRKKIGKIILSLKKVSEPILVKSE